MSLVELIAQADDRGLAAAGLACLDRCLPLLGTIDDELLRPLWASLDHDGGGDWPARLAEVRDACAAPTEGDEAAGDEAVVLVRRMLSAAPDRLPSPGLRAWADASSVAALQVHRLLDGTPADGPLTTGELRRQVSVLEHLTSSAGGLRHALVVSTEGRRIVRAVVSRQARVRS